MDLWSFRYYLKTWERIGKKIQIIKQTESFCYINANKNPGAIVGKFAADIAINKAAKNGVGLASIKNMITWLRPGTIAKYIADKDYISIVINNSGNPLVAPPGGYEPVIGTNPIGIGIPTTNNPIVTDMSTSNKAWGEVRIAKESGKKLTSKSFFDSEGKYTTDANNAFSAVPFGGYKGFALGILIEILTGSFLDMPMSDYQKTKDNRISTRNGIIIVLNPKCFTDLEKFKKANSNLIKKIKNSKKIKGINNIIIPGERALSYRNKIIQNGFIRINKKIWQEIINY